MIKSRSTNRCKESEEVVFLQICYYLTFNRYGRLKVCGVVTSKRKIADLVSNNHVRGWDDPRLYTLIGLRRRGVPPDAILAFVNGLGVTKAVVQIAVNRFEQTVRDSLEFSVPRLMLVVDPILVVIDGLPDDHLEMIEVPFSRDPSFGVRTFIFNNISFLAPPLSTDQND